MSEELEWEEERRRRRKEWERRMAEQLKKLKHPRLRILVETYYDIQELRKAAASRLRNYEKFDLLTPTLAARLQNLVVDLKRMEQSMAELVEDELESIPIWFHLQKVKGCGPMIAGGLIGWIDDISKADTISSLWRYAGLAPGQKRRAGEKLDYNPKLKDHMWRVGTQLLKAQRKRYKPFAVRLYERFKSQEGAKEFESPRGGHKLHIHRRAFRRMLKVFLGALWLRWREIEDLPITPPYAHAKLEHKKLYRLENFYE